MTSRFRLVVIALVGFVLLAAEGAARQGTPTVRMRGRALAEDGAGIQGVTVRTDAVRGIAGGQFVGQREFKARTDKRGNWSLLGITRGLWIFEFSAEDYAPHVVAVPVMMMEASPLPTVPWYLSITLQRKADVGAITEALGKILDQLAAGSRDEAVAALHQVPLAAVSPEGLCAGGDVALLLRDVSAARGLFEQAAQARPDWPRAQLGIGSAAMLQGDYGAAATAYARVRDTSKNQELQQAMSAAIRDLTLIAGVRSRG